MNRDVISLFAGAMGLDAGLMKAGLRIAVAQDNDPVCIKTITANGHKAIGGDIRKISSEALLQSTGLKFGEPFLLCGGPPCQPFSTAGKRQGINDPRGSLFIDYLRMVDEIRPRFFLLENVRGLESAEVGEIPADLRESLQPTPGTPTGPGSVLRIILDEFAKLEYKTVFGVLDAIDYGTPQFRERFIMIGSRDQENVFLPFPTHFQIHQDPSYRWKTLRSAIEHLESTEMECASFGTERLALLKLVPEGGNWRNLPADIQEQAMGGAYRSNGGKVGFYRRLAYDQPAPTLVTSPVQKSSMLCHPKLDRPLGVQEYARIQQFPDSWRFVGNGTDKYRQIGNAVPVGLAEALGKALIATAEGNAAIQTKRRSKNIMRDRSPAMLCP